MLHSQSEMTIYDATETQEFGNDWGLFIKLDVEDSKYKSKHKFINNTLDVIMEEELAMENNSECLKSETTKTYACCCCSKYLSIFTKTIAIACVIFYVI